MKLDNRGIIETVIPKPYIKSVILEEVGVNEALSLGYTLEEPAIVKTQFGRLKRKRKPLVSSQTDRYLFVKAVIVVKDYEITRGRTSWITNDNIVNSLKLKVILASGEKAIKTMSSGKLNKKKLGVAKSLGIMEEQIIPLEPPELSEIEKKKIDERVVYSIEYEMFFVLPKEEPKDLAMFAYVFVEDPELEIVDNDDLQSATTSKMLIKDSNVRLEGNVFLTDEDKVWTGPIHKRGNKYFGGFRDKRTPLQRRRILDNSIIDKRDLNLSTEFLLSNIDTKQEQRKRKIKKLSKAESEDYFTNLFVTRDENNRARGLFSIDIMKMLNRESIFGKYTETLSNNAKKSIVENTRIASFLLYRERVEKDPLTQRTVSFAEEPSDELIVVSKDNRKGNLKTDKRERSPTSNKRSKKALVGSVKEVHLSMPASFRSFTFTDNDMAGRTDGTYRYYVDLNFEDGIIEYMRNIVITTNEINASLESYLADAVLDRNQQDGFSDGFIKKYRTFYPFNTPKFNNAPWIRASRKLWQILTNLSSLDETRVERILLNFIQITDPRTGNIEGIQLLNDILREAIIKIKKENPKLRFDEEVDYGNKSFASKGKDIGTITVRKTFPQVLESSFLDGVGYDFLGVNSQNSPGLRRLPPQAYKQRISKEMKKYYTQSVPKSLKHGGSSETNLFSFLTVANILLGPSKVSLLGRGKRHFDNEQYVHALNSIVSFNESGDILALSSKRYFNNYKSDKLTAEQKQDNVLLTNIMSSMGVTLQEDYISIKEESNKGGKKRRKKNAGEIMGEATNFLASDSLNIPEDQSVLDGDNDSLMQSTDLRSLGSVIGFTSDSLDGRDERDDTSFEMTVRDFDLRTPNNALSRRKKGNQTKRIDELPNQFKAILNSRESEVNVNWLDRKSDIFKDVKSAGMTYYNFLYIQRIEYLETFESDSEFYPRKPVWKKLDKRAMNSLDEDDMILCRMIEHRDSFGDIGGKKNLKLPVFNEFFFIGANKEERVPRIRERAAQRLINRYSRSSRFPHEFIHNMDIEQPLEDIEVGTKFDSKKGKNR